MVAVAVSGCGSARVESSTWLLVVGEDTLTVGDMGDAWTAMDQDQRDLFLEKENTIGEYIVTYGRKMLLQKELGEIGYLDDPGLQSRGDSWFRERTGEQYRRVMHEYQQANVAQEDIDHFMSNLGRYAFFTTDPGTDLESSYGPVHMPSLPDDMIFLIDSLQPGATGETETGMLLRLDSLQIADSAAMSEMTADSAALRANIVSSISNKRYGDQYDDLRAALLTDYDLYVDSTLLQSIAVHFSSDSALPGADEILMESTVGSWTAGDFLKEIDYYEAKYHIDPGDILWLEQLLELVHYNGYAMSMMTGDHQDILDSLSAEREVYILETAADRFYEDRIQSAVTVTDEDMHRLFDNMEEPLTVPEKRVVQAVQLPRDSVMVWRSLPEEQRNAYMLRMQGFVNLAADSSRPQITRPLNFNEIPGFHGEEVFSADPSDTTTWLGPFELYGGENLCMFRLLDVIPERNATFEEVEPRIRAMTRNRLEEQATVEEMRRLEELYGMTINEEILDLLPEDPGLWSSL
jgi:hypothetical protein